MAQLHGAAAEFAQREFGGVIAPSQEVQVIGTSISSVLGNDPERVSFFLMNLSANVIYLSTDQNPSSSNGIQLTANGGFLGFNAKDDQILSTLGFWGVASAASSNLLVLEQRRISGRIPEGT